MRILATFVVLLLLLSLYTNFSSCSSPRNIAEGKPCIVSPPPSYPLTALPAQVSVLTDGKYTRGKFWTQRSTVGWFEPGKVEITIDLGAVYTVGAISFSTARGESADVRYPEHVYAFLGRDPEHLSYAGDIMPRELLRGGYQTRLFTLDAINLKGRYVLLVAYPDGPYLFCDEIVVNEGAAGHEPDSTTTAARALAYAEQIRKRSIHASILHKLADQLQTPTPQQKKGGAPADAHALINSAIGTPGRLESLEDTLLTRHAGELRAEHPAKEFVTSTMNPWAPVSLVGVERSSTTFPVPITASGYNFAALTVTNIRTTARELSVTTEDDSPGLASVSLYVAPFVLSSSTREYVADPLVPCTGSVKLRSGESALLLARISGRTAGSGKVRIRIAAGEEASQVSIPYKVFRKVPASGRLNSVNWAYMSFKPIANKRQQAVRDLLLHHTNVLVVPPAFNPAPRGTTLPELKSLRSYLHLHQGMDKVLFFLDVQNSGWRTMTQSCSFMDDTWAEAFDRWYTAMLRIAAAEGFAEKHVYIYPYDEPQPGRIEEVIRFTKMIRKAIPGIQLFSTINNREALEEIAPQVDVAQMYDILPWQRPASKTEYWRYLIVTKATLPYETMRLQAWQAFVHGYKGIGFWNYADTGGGNDAGSNWDDFDGTHPDHAVVYEGPGDSLLSSRRWEAWKLGLEDYQLLAAYASHAGRTAAQALAEDVISHPEDRARADSARSTMLNVLAR